MYSKHTAYVCYRYEDEINKRNNLENDFVILKKVRGRTQTHTCIIPGVLFALVGFIFLFWDPGSDQLHVFFPNIEK